MGHAGDFAICAPTHLGLHLTSPTVSGLVVAADMLRTRTLKKKCRRTIYVLTDGRSKVRVGVATHHIITHHTITHHTSSETNRDRPAPGPPRGIHQGCMCFIPQEGSDGGG
jgi:hypothetical protein